ncbi:hypothetical protein V6N11_078908 [Hibiscus sabdariffa]|uniref:Rx N-terminal domain-containing protein n=1 Tax=Hibiscus sabdariffa TaxID=183260 RepID=A0ABR2RU38_9ROSI
MAESIAYDIITKLSSPLLQQLGLWWNLKDDLRSIVSAIKAVLLDSEEKSVSSNLVKDCLEKLKDALYDADDILDDIHTEAQRKDLMSRNKLTKEVRVFFSSTNQIAYGLKMGRKIKAIKARLSSIQDETKLLNLVERDHPVETPFMARRRQQTHSFVRNIIKSLTNEAPDQNLEMDQLQKQLRDKIDGKKYLLVLDDIWNEEWQQWCSLKKLLMGGARGKEFKAANLKGKQHLQSLFLEWSNAKEDEEKSLEDLQPHPNLKELHVVGWRGDAKFPSWLSLFTNLTRVTIIGPGKFKHLPSFAQLPHLKHLAISKLTELEYMDDNCPIGGHGEPELFFPSLTSLALKNCPNMKSWWKTPVDDDKDTTIIGASTMAFSLSFHFMDQRLPFDFNASISITG